MKQQIVMEIKLDDEKSRSKAFKIAGEEQGVTSVSMEEENKMVVIGNNVNLICLFNQLVKKFPCMRILSVEEVPPPPPAPTVEDDEPTSCVDDDDDHRCTSKGHAEAAVICSRCQSSECDGNCCYYPLPYHHRYVPYCPPPFDPSSYRVVYDSYSDCWSTNK